MNTISSSQLMSVHDYLAGELSSDVKHEYLGGVIYAMAGGRFAHNAIATNCVGLLHAQLRGKPCRPMNSDMKVRVQSPTQTRFYYPDASVICKPVAPDDIYQDNPAIIVEVLSKKTRRIDEGEKKDAYLTIPTLKTYLLIEQESPTVTLFRRTEQGFVREVVSGLEKSLLLPEIEAELPLAELYEGVEFAPEPDDEEPR